MNYVAIDDRYVERLENGMGNDKTPLCVCGNGLSGTPPSGQDPFQPLDRCHKLARAFLFMSKITKDEFVRLNQFYQRIEPPAQNYLYGSGDHYELYRLLCSLGFRPPKDAIDVYRMAEDVLAGGYE